MRYCSKYRQGNGNGGHRPQFSLEVLVDRVSPRGSTSRIHGEANTLYDITCHQEQENSSYVNTGKTKVLTFDLYTLDDLSVNLSFVTLYISMRFDILLERLLHPSVLQHLLVSLL